MAYLLALDQGTTSSRALIFDESGHIHALAQQEFEQFYPRPGWVEHDPQEILKTQLDVAAEAIQQAQLTSRDIAGIGITNQRETCLLWERSSGRPCSNALVWQDRRGADVCEGLRAAGTEPMFSQKTGLLLDPYFSASKLHWIIILKLLIQKVLMLVVIRANPIMLTRMDFLVLQTLPGIVLVVLQLLKRMV